LVADAMGQLLAPIFVYSKQRINIYKAIMFKTFTKRFHSRPQFSPPVRSVPSATSCTRFYTYIYIYIYSISFILYCHFRVYSWVDMSLFRLSARMLVFRIVLRVAYKQERVENRLEKWLCLMQ
jgi:hypothetical protein